MGHKKKILIPIYDAMVLNNLINDRFLDILSKEDIDVVIIPQKGRVEEYKIKFKEYKGVIIENSEFWVHSKFRDIVTQLFVNSIPTHFMKMRQVYRFKDRGRYVEFYLMNLLRFFGRYKFFKTILRLMEELLPIPKEIKEIYHKWSPDLVVSPTMMAWRELDLIKLGKRNGAKTIGMVKSWDNLTTKLFLRCFPDKLLVQQDIQAHEANFLYQYPKEKVVITGPPQFDMYQSNDFILDKKTFFDQIGADSDKEIILYAAAGDWMTLHDKEVLLDLLGAINSGKIKNAQVLLRLHPAYESETEQLSNIPNLIIERPGRVVERTGDFKLKFDFDQEDTKQLANSIYHSSVVINTTSSISIDAAIYDKPIVLIGYDGDAVEPINKSVLRYYDVEHYRPILDSNGVWLVRSSEEFIKAVRSYLEQPSLHKEGRSVILREQCYKCDGFATKRIAAEMVSMV